MAEQIKLVAESLTEWGNLQDNKDINEQAQVLNEGAKGLLQKFINNPAKKKALTSAFARQLGKVKGLKDALLKLDDDKQLNLAKQALKALEDPTKGYAWLKVANGQITGAGALGVKKAGVGKELGT